MSLRSEVLAAVESVLGDGVRAGLHEPSIGALESHHVDRALESGFVSSVGEYVTRFEQDLAAFTGAAGAVAVSNGTSALHVALVLAGVEAGDLVIVPALSFVATANAVSHAGATPWFADSEISTLGLSPAAVAALLATTKPGPRGPVDPVSGRRVAAIVPMHTLGIPVDIVGLLEVAQRHGVPVVEDAAESLGSWVGDTHTGRFGEVGILSFNGNKIVTTGGGGAIIADDLELLARAKHLTTTAKLPHRWEFEHDEVAWNYRMPNLNAALGVAQLERLPGFLAAKRELAAQYRESLAGIEGVEFVTEPRGSTSNYWLNAIRLLDPSLEVRDELLGALNDAGFGSRPMWNLLSEQRMYSSAPRGDLSTATSLVDSLICLPSSPGLLR